MSPMLTAVVLLSIASFICVIAAANNKCSLWIPVLLLNVIVLLQVLPR